MAKVVIFSMGPDPPSLSFSTSGLDGETSLPRVSALVAKFRPADDDVPVVKRSRS